MKIHKPVPHLFLSTIVHETKFQQIPRLKVTINLRIAFVKQTTEQNKYKISRPKFSKVFGNYLLSFED